MKKNIIIAISILALASCSKQNLSLDEIRFNITMPEEYTVKAGTRATATSFENGDAVSLYAVEGRGQDAAADRRELPQQ